VHKVLLLKHVWLHLNCCEAFYLLSIPSGNALFQSNVLFPCSLEPIYLIDPFLEAACATLFWQMLALTLKRKVVVISLLELFRIAVSAELKARSADK
jgi:hypothetical protein